MSTPDQEGPELATGAGYDVVPISPLGRLRISCLVVWNMAFIFPYIRNNTPN